MANDGGYIGIIEEWMVSLLAAAQINSKDAFKTVEIWKWQLGAGSGGNEAFTRHAPFAFVGFEPDTGAGREGDHDLRQVLRYVVAIGAESKLAGVARIGDADHFGVSILHQTVISTLENKHPGASVPCDDFYYVGTELRVHTPKRYGVELFFEANLTT